MHILLLEKLHSNKKEGRRTDGRTENSVATTTVVLLRMVIKANFCLLSSMHLRVEKGQHRSIAVVCTAAASFNSVVVEQSPISNAAIP